MKKNTLFFCLLLCLSGFSIRELKAQLPQIGAELWLEPHHTASSIDSMVAMMAAHHMKAIRVFIGQGDVKNYDYVFSSAEKYGLKIQATLTVPEHTPTESDLRRHAEYVKRIVNRYKNSPALETWWLMNEPGNGPSSSPLAMQHFREWLEKKYGNIKSLNALWRKGYPSFGEIEYNENWSKASNLSNTTEYFDWFQFSRDNLTWIQEWIADEVKKQDTLHQFHVNPAGIFNNLIQYDFPGWRRFLTSLGASIHPSWHFGMLSRDQFAMGIAATCDIIKGGSEPNPFWVSELQSGNNIWSGSRPVGPEAADIAQWTWTSIGCGAEKVIYWLFNNRSKGGESGEWSMLDFQGRPSDRLETASAISKTMDLHKDFFSGARALERKVVILLSPETMLVQARKAARDNEPGRGTYAHILSALSYYQAFSELGIPATFKYTDDFDWENKKGYLAVFPDAVSVPLNVVKRAETFVANGNKLLIDGLTGFFDEKEVNVLQTGFFFEPLCGATIRDIRTIRHLFPNQINQLSTPLPGHLWQTEILNHSATVIGREGTMITATRNKFGKGEVIWLPMLAGLGAWLDKNNALAELLSGETITMRKELPLHFLRKTDNVMMQVLENKDGYVSVITNGTDKSQEVSLQVNGIGKPEVIYNSDSSKMSFSPSRFKLGGRQTIVVRWKATR